MYCPNCGFRNEDDCNFCVNCGAPLGSAHSAEEHYSDRRDTRPLRNDTYQADQGSYYVDDDEYYEEGRSNVKFIIAVVAIALVLGVAAFGVVHFLLGSHGQPSDGATPPIVDNNDTYTTEYDSDSDVDTYDSNSDSDTYNGGTACSNYSSNDYIIPDSDSRYLTDGEVSSLSQREIQYAINEIYARHGATFDDQDVKNYFYSKDWYSPSQSKDDAKKEFNKYEKANIDLLSKYRK